MPRLGRVHACLFAILGFLPFRIPACIVPILFCNVLSISRRWHLAERIVCDSLTRRKAWGLLLSGLMAAATTILPEPGPFLLPDSGPETDQF